VPDPVAERVRVGFPEFLVVMEAEEAGPGGQVGGDVRGDDPAAVDLQVFDGKLRRPMALAVRAPAIPASGMLVQVMEYFQPVVFS
jgi:hypothetical protein